MVRSFLVSLLTSKYGPTQGDAFEKAMPGAWLVWEPGHWAPLPQADLAKRTLVAMPRPQIRRAAPTLALAMHLGSAAPGATLQLGREPSCELHINDKTLSRQHLQFTQQGSAWFVRDLGSANGTLVNRTKLAPNVPLELREGAQIDAGEVLLTFHESRGMFFRCHADLKF